MSLEPVPWLWLSRFGNNLDTNRPLDHLGIVSAAPEMLSALSNGAACGYRAFDLRHVTVLTDKTTLLHPVPAFVFGIGAARSPIIKLRRAPYDTMAPITELGRAEAGIEFRGMGCDGIVKGSEDHSIPDVAGRASHSFDLIVRIVVRIRLLNGSFHPVSWDFFDQRGLLVF
jgi:hypothetical protein